MNEYTLQKHPLFDMDLCCFFAGRLMSMPKAEEIYSIPRKLAGKNFTAVYKTLSLQEKTLVREAIRQFKENPKQIAQEFTECINESLEDEELMQRIKKSDL